MIKIYVEKQRSVCSKITENKIVSPEDEKFIPDALKKIENSNVKDYSKEKLERMLQEAGETEVRLVADARVDVNGDVLRISDEIPFFALLNPAEKIGVGTVKDMYANVGPDGTLPVVFDNSFYLSNLGREGLMFFFRPLVYFNIGFDRKQLITVPGGSVYAERNLFPFFESNDPQPIQYVLALAAAVRAKAKVSIGAILWPPSR